MHSKALHAFNQRLDYFDDDIELVDVLRASIVAGDLSNNAGTKPFDRVDPAIHRHLARRSNSDGTRENCIHHLRSSVHSSYIKDTYEEVTEYLKSVLRAASLQGFSAGRIIGEHSFKMDASTVLSFGSWDAVCRSITDSVFQALEAERSTLNLIKKSANKLGLNLTQSFVDEALPYLETRHFLVHADGKLSREFTATNPHIRHQNGFVVLDYAFMTEFKNKVRALINHYDQQIIAANFLAAGDIHGQ